MADLDLPVGAVAFLFTDLEGSTAPQQAHPAAYAAALRRHHDLLRGAVEAHGGVVFETVGDAVYAAFPRPTDAVRAALAGQLALHQEPWGEVGPLRARMGVHLGEVEAYPAPGAAHGARYLGLPLSRCARLMATAHGGQVVLSGAAVALVRDALPARAGLLDLGAYRLKDLQHPERVFQLTAPGLPADFPALRTLDARPHNLPLQLTSFVGRERELVEVGRLLARHRLVTLTGAGGCGKTRLALQAAADGLDAWPDGVWFVDLAPLTDPALVPQAALAALGLGEAPGRPPLERLTDALRPGRALLLLDNCEHLVGACAALAEHLLRACPRLGLLATSRELLGGAGEAVWRVPSLAVPDPDGLPDPAALGRSPAVRLFAERARLRRPGFAVTAANAPAVAQVCRRLDGIPLALELAAARVAVLPVEQLAARLDDRFRLLTGGSRTALRRQQTLRGAIDWSYGLLAARERVVLQRLAVFAGGCTLEAAEAVCADPAPPGPARGRRPARVGRAEVLDRLTALVQKSLALAEDAGGEARYHLQETIRQYAAEKLLDAGEAAAVRARHRDVFLALAERAAPELGGRDQVAWLDRLEAEHDNLRAALAWSQAGDQDGGAELRLAGALGRFWRVRGHVAEGRAWLGHALARGSAAPGPDRVRALAFAGHLAYIHGDLPRGRALLEEGVAAARRLPGHPGLAQALRHLAYVARDGGDDEAWWALCEEALASAREEGDARETAWGLFLVGAGRSRRGDPAGGLRLIEAGLAACRALGDTQGVQQALSVLSSVALEQGQTARARRLLHEALAHARALKNRGMESLTLAHLAGVARDEGDVGAAGALARQALVAAREAGERWQISLLLEVCGGLDAVQGRAARAVRLFGAAAGLRLRAGIHPRGVLPWPRVHYEQDLAAARAALDEPAFARAWAAGEAMTLEEAAADALAAERPEAPPDPT